MALAYYSGWDFARIGTFAMRFTDSDGTHDVSITSGTYSHIDLQSIMGTGSYDDFATKLKTEMDALSTVTYTVTFSSSTFLYTIDTDAGNVVIESTSTNTVAKNILGFNSLPTAAAGLITSQIRPYYVISPGIAGRSNVSDDYEAGEISYDGEADDGNAFGISRTTAPLFQDWMQAMEAKAAVFKRLGTSTVPFTYQHLFEHARNIEPLLIQDADGGASTDDLVCKFTAQGSMFKPMRVTADYDDQWNIPFGVRLVQTAGVARI